jgi:DNA-binding transcriptional LysR family regulator
VGLGRTVDFLHATNAVLVERGVQLPLAGQPTTTPADQQHMQRFLRDKPAGIVRITTAEHAANNVVWPALCKFLPAYPDVKVEITVDDGLTDIVADRFDEDMIAVRIGPDMRMAVVGSPSYFDQHPIPRRPQDLTEHDCINMRLPTYGGLYVWEFEKDGQALNVRVAGQLTFNSSTPRVRAALAGFGLAFVPEDMVYDHVKGGELVRVLEDWCHSFPGYHAYYPSRRQSSPALKLIVDALRQGA